MHIAWLTPLLAIEWSADYFLRDDDGRRITAAVALLLGVVVLYLLLRMIARRQDLVRKLVALAVILAAAVWALGAMQNLTLVGWAVTGVIAFGMLLGLALFMSRH